jgi:hypothetical protein
VSTRLSEQALPRGGLPSSRVFFVSPVECATALSSDTVSCCSQSDPTPTGAAGWRRHSRGQTPLQTTAPCELVASSHGRSSRLRGGSTVTRGACWEWGPLGVIR